MRSVRLLPCVLGLVLALGCGGTPRARTPHAPAAHVGRPPEQFIQSTHWGDVTTLAFSPDGAYLASAAEDRTLRVWDVPRRRELRIFPVDGEVTSLSWDGHARLMVGREHERAVLLDVQKGTEIAELGAIARTGPFRVPGNPARWLAWADRGSHFDEGLATFDDDGNRVANLESLQAVGDAPIAFTPDASAASVAPPFIDTKPVLLHRVGASFVPVDVKLPAAPPDSRWTALVPAPGAAAAALLGESGPSYLVGARAPRPLPTPADHVVRTAVFSPSADALAVVLADKTSWFYPGAGSLAVVDVATDALRFAEAPGGTTVLAFSPDGRTIAAGDVLGRITLFDARTGRHLGAFGQRIVGGGWLHFEGNELVVESCRGVTRWSLVTGALLRRRAIKCDEKRIRSLDRAHAAGLTRVVTAPDGTTYAGDEDGNLLVTRGGRTIARGKSDGLAIEQLVLDPKAGRLASVSSDQIVRIWDAKTAAVRALFIAFDDDEWMATTPRGAYFGTREVDDRVGWVYEDPLDLYSFAQFKGEFESPDQVRRRLAGEDVEAPTYVPRPPSVKLVSAPTTPVRSVAATVRVAVGSESRVAAVRAFVEARLVAEVHPSPGARTVDLAVPLRSGTNHVSVVAFDDQGIASNELPLEIQSLAPPGARPDVWVVAIGVSAYPHLLDLVRLPPARRARELADLQLHAARRDAEAIAGAMGAMAGPGKAYARAHVVLLPDARADGDSIRRALGGLAAMRPSDLGVIFFAGHGLESRHGDMVLVTGGAQLAADGKGLTPESLAGATVGWQELADALSRAKGRVLVLLDACHSGHFNQDLVPPNGVLADRLVRDGRAGAIVFAAAKGRQSSYEGDVRRDARAGAAAGRAPRAMHGLFTSAILDALADASTDRNHDGTLQASELIDATTDRVSQASGGKQTPWVVRREEFGDFALKRVAR